MASWPMWQPESTPVARVCKTFSAAAITGENPVDNFISAWRRGQCGSRRVLRWQGSAKPLVQRRSQVKIPSTISYQHGVVAKWQGKGLQNPDHGFKSRRRL